MCSLDDIQQEIADLAGKLDQYHADSERDHTALSKRLSTIENTYLTQLQIQDAITAALRGPLQEIQTSLSEIKALAEDNQLNLEPWNRRQRQWSVTAQIAHVIGDTAAKGVVRLGKVATGVTALYGLYEFLTAMGWL